MGIGPGSGTGGGDGRAHTGPAGDWGRPTCFVFRFVFVYFLVEFHTAVLQLLPLLEPVATRIDEAKRPFYVWIADRLLGIRIDTFSTSSGDTTYDWVRVAANLAMAALGGVLWTMLDRRRAHPRLADGLRIAIRYVLALSMFTYGLAKVFPLQFQPPEVQTLLKTYGESSPMGLLWTFMGASRPYTIFAGWTEILGGLLLCFRSTQVAGALWTAGVMANVFMLNLCYDVPVKLFSLQLLAMALAVAAPDVPRLAGFFLRNAPVPPADLDGPWTDPRWRRAASAIRVVWLVVTLGVLGWFSAQTASLLVAPASDGGRAGTWEIGEFSRDGGTLPPVAGDARRWRFLTVVERPQGKAVMVRAMDRSERTWVFEGADGGDMLTLFDPARGDPLAPGKGAVAGSLTLVQESEDELRGGGDIGGERIEFRARRVRAGDFLLVNRGFRLVSEAPFNR